MEKREAFKNEREFLDFARSYLSEAFPNPERTGCPPDDALRRRAFHPSKADEWVIDHLTWCSPCFNAYMAHLADLKAKSVQQQREHRIIWIRRSAAAVAVAAILISALYLFVPRWRHEQIIAPRAPVPTTPGTPSPAPVPATVVIDLSNAAPQRGTPPDIGGRVRQVIPASSHVDLSLRLPLGSEERLYSITLTSGQGTVWSQSTQGHRQKGAMILRVSADLSRISPGDYDLRVASGKRHLSVPVSVTAALPETTSPK